MKNDYPDNFIKVSENILTEGQIDFLIDLVNNQDVSKLPYPTPNGEFWQPRKNSMRNDAQFPLCPFWSQLSEEINLQLYNKLLIPYSKDFPTIIKKSESYLNGTILIQKTEPAGGFHIWHAENDRWNFRNRMFAWMIYLNDIEDGGETEFIYQKIRFKPRRNMGLIWPGGFTHSHRGNPPLSETKYILTGWINPVGEDLIDVDYSKHRN